MNCLLCLESCEDSSSSINISSPTGIAQNINEVICKHFWIKPDPTNQNIICSGCWISLSAFHEFYVRIQKCHQLLTETLSNGAVKRDATEPSSISAETPPAKRRGRPRRNNAIKFEEKTVSSRTQRDKEEISTMKQKLRSSNTNLSYSTATPKNACHIGEIEGNGEEIKSEQVKSEFLQVETLVQEDDVGLFDIIGEMAIDKNDEKPLHEITIKEEFISASSLTAEDPIVAQQSDEEQEELSSKKSASKECSYLRKTLISKNYDEFIAAHFKLSCCLCSEPIENFAALKSHFRTEHNTRGYVRCCGKKLLKRGVLVDHLHVHQDPKYFKCTLCDKVLSNRSSLENHIKIKHNERRERNIQCDICLKRFFSRAVFHRHCLMHVPEEQKTVPCPKCEKM